MVATSKPWDAVALEAPRQRIKTHDDIRLAQGGQRLRHGARRVGRRERVWRFAVSPLLGSALAGLFCDSLVERRHLCVALLHFLVALASAGV